MYLLLLLLTLAPPSFAHHIDEAQHLSGTEICAAVADEMDHAVNFKLISQEEANDIILRCLVNYQ